MKFEGTVAIDAPRPAIWNALTDPALLVKLTPGVRGYKTLVPNEKFELETGFQFAAQTFNSPVVLRWTEFQPEELLGVDGQMSFGGEQFSFTGRLTLAEGVAFSAEIPKHPTNLPRSLVHQFAVQTIRAFFKNLKAELE